LDGDNQFDPSIIRSQFLHIFIVVQEDTKSMPGKKGWRVAVCSNNAVPAFGPPLPTPPIFYNPQELKDYLLAKSELLFFCFNDFFSLFS